MSRDTDKIHEVLGYIRAKVEAIDDKLGVQNGRLIAVEKTVSKHDLIFGKIGVVFTIVLFALTTAINFILDAVKSKLK